MLPREIGQADNTARYSGFSKRSLPHNYYTVDKLNCSFAVTRFYKNDKACPGPETCRNGDVQAVEVI